MWSSSLTTGSQSHSRCFCKSRYCKFFLRTWFTIIFPTSPATDHLESFKSWCDYAMAGSEGLLASCGSILRKPSDPGSDVDKFESITYHTFVCWFEVEQTWHIEWVCPGRSWEMCLWFHVLRFYCCFNLCSQFSFDFIAGMVGNVSADAWACSSWGAMVTKAPCATCWHWDVKCLIAARCISRSWCLMDKLFKTCTAVTSMQMQI